MKLPEGLSSPFVNLAMSLATSRPLIRQRLIRMGQIKRIGESLNKEEALKIGADVFGHNCGTTVVVGATGGLYASREFLKRHVESLEKIRKEWKEWKELEKYRHAIVLPQSQTQRSK